MDISETIIEDLNALAGAICDTKADRDVNWYMWAERSTKPGCVVQICYAENVVFFPTSWTELHFASISDAKAWLAKALLSDCAKELGASVEGFPRGVSREGNAQITVTQFGNHLPVDGLSNVTTAKLGHALFEVANAECFELQAHQ